VTVSILVVDDESDMVELFRQRFRREVRQGKYTMHFANSGEDALGKLAGGVEPTLIAILSDINMPGMDGLDLLGELKRRYPELPVMMVTAYGDDERRRRADELGAAEFVTKPVDFDRLKVRLRQLPNAADAVNNIGSTRASAFCSRYRRPVGAAGASRMPLPRSST
jgi:CheY-like chemotaxis protein